MKKRILGILLAVCLLFGVLPVTASATVVSGSCGTSATWKFDDSTGTLTIGGTGDMKDYDSASKVPWFDYRMSVKSVVIGNSITSIGNNAFYYCNSLTSVTIGTAVKSIGIYAFRHCASLTTVYLPNSVKTIEECAFFSCSSLQYLDLGAVTSIGNYAFYGCTAMTSVAIPSTVTSIGGCAFYNCSSLAAATFAGNPPSLGTYAFNGCASGFTVYYYVYTTGWDTDGDGYWNGYPVMCETIPVRFNLNGGSFDTTVRATAQVNAVNKFRDLNQLVVYSGGAATGANIYGTEVIVDSNGLVTEVRSDKGNSAIPAGGFVLSGHGTMKLWLDKNTASGLYIYFDSANMQILVYSTQSAYLAQHKTVVHGGTYGALPTPTRTGYFFDGWFTAASGGTQVLSTTTVTANATHTLFARWSHSTDAGLGNFSTNSAIYAGFADVDENQWYGSNREAAVKQAVSLGIMDGYSDGTFRPTAQIQLCEAIKMAAVVNNIYYGGATALTDSASGPWYTNYLNYAISQGIIASTDFADYTVYATRAQIAYIFAGAVPNDALTAINNMSYYDIPDVTSTTAYATQILQLYRAGILSGGTGGAFSPYNSVTRAEAAALIARIALPSSRIVYGSVSSVAISYSGAVVSDITLYTGASVTLIATLTPSSSTATATWKSADPAIAKIDANGVVTGVAYGNTTVHVECGGYTASCIVRVR